MKTRRGPRKPVGRDPDGRPLCRQCRGPVPAPRRTFCLDACVIPYQIERGDIFIIRRELLARERGICQVCRLDLVAVEAGFRLVLDAFKREFPRQDWTMESWGTYQQICREQEASIKWEADHIVPVADGGGQCGLDGYRLLCRACHVTVTAKWRRARAQERRTTARPLLIEATA